MDGAHDYHNFQSKLLQRPAWNQVEKYVRWQQMAVAAESTGDKISPPQTMVPLSINLDLTTACNYRCDHCIDWDILNSGLKHKEEKLRDSSSRVGTPRNEISDSHRRGRTKPSILDLWR